MQRGEKEDNKKKNNHNLHNISIFMRLIYMQLIGEGGSKWRQIKIETDKISSFTVPSFWSIELENWCVYYL